MGGQYHPEESKQEFLRTNFESSGAIKVLPGVFTHARDDEDTPGSLLRKQKKSGFQPRGLMGVPGRGIETAGICESGGAVRSFQGLGVRVQGLGFRI
jgi:hypothetical protein